MQENITHDQERKKLINRNRLRNDSDNGIKKQRYLKTTKHLILLLKLIKENVTIMRKEMEDLFVYLFICLFILLFIYLVFIYSLSIHGFSLWLSESQRH